MTTSSQNQSCAEIINTILVKLQCGLNHLQNDLSHDELEQIKAHITKLFLNLSCDCIHKTEQLSTDEITHCMGIISSYLTTHAEKMTKDELEKFRLASKFLYSDFENTYIKEIVTRAANENRSCKFSYAKIDISNVKDKTALYYCLRFSKLNYVINKGFIVIPEPSWNDTEFLNILKWRLRNHPEAIIEIIPCRGKKKLGADERFIKSHS